MATIFNGRKLGLPKMSRMSVIVGTLAAILGLIAALVGYQLYKKLTTNTAVAYFSEALALYPGDRVQIMGIKVGNIDKIEPAGDKMKVTFHYANKYKVPADATATILNPSLVASRVIQLAPAYTGGPVLADNAVIPIERTQVPVEWDDLRNQISELVTTLGPTPEQPKGPFGDILESFADGLEGKGAQINTTFRALSDAVTALNEGRGDFFGVLKSLALFVNALHKSDRQLVSLNTNLATLSTSFSNSDQEVANTVRDLNTLLTTARTFIDQNGPVLGTDIKNLAEVTNQLMQPEARDGIETVLHVYPNLGANLQNIYHPTHGALVAIPVVASFANPIQFLCSAIQAGSRLGYQDSAELCAQYLAPVLDAIKFNFPPFGMNPISTAETLPKYVAYSEPRLQPPPGYKDTTVPGIWSRDTLFSHGNSSTVPWHSSDGPPDWIVAPGMQGLDVGAFTANMLTPDSLAELMGGPDRASIPPAGPPGGAPPNAYDQNNPLPPPWYPEAIPPPPPAPGVIPGPLPPSQQINGGATAPAGPALPAEMGGGQ